MLLCMCSLVGEDEHLPYVVCLTAHLLEPFSEFENYSRDWKAVLETNSMSFGSNKGTDISMFFSII
jgi:hypothetical protein